MYILTRFVKSCIGLTGAVIETYVKSHSYSQRACAGDLGDSLTAADVLHQYGLFPETESTHTKAQSL